MPFNEKLQKFNSNINTVIIGYGKNTVKFGGESIFPFYLFDNLLTNLPKIGVEISDLGITNDVDGIKQYYCNSNNIVEIAKKAELINGVDFVCLRLEGGDPNGSNKSIPELIEIVKKVSNSITLPLVVEGCKNTEKNSKLLPKVAEILQGKNVLILSAKEENYKSIGASVGLAYNQKIGAESAVDINLAKQLNVILTQLGIKQENIVMNVGSVAVGYGFEYLISTIDRIKNAALVQNDNMLKMPIITPVADEAWSVKESIVSEKDMPEWGPVENRGISIEIQTAASVLAAGSDAVILKHPKSITTISKMIKELSILT